MRSTYTARTRAIVLGGACYLNVATDFFLRYYN